MPRYFEALPPVQYNNKQLRNLLFRPQIVQNKIKLNPQSFYPYVVSDDMSIDLVSFYYYGSVEYTWLIMLANEIVDPYFQWPLTSRELEKYIISKYGSLTAAQNKILYKKDANGNLYSPDTTLSRIQSTNFTVNNLAPTLTNVSAYDKEVEDNEKKRHIVLLDNSYLIQINQELGTLYNGRI